MTHGGLVKFQLLRFGCNNVLEIWRKISYGVCRTFMNGISSEPDPLNISIVFAIQTNLLQTKVLIKPPPPSNVALPAYSYSPTSIINKNKPFIPYS